MIKVSICVTRRADMTREQFDAYWRDKHGPLVKSVGDFARHIRKYVQCHLTKSPVIFGQEAAYDGIAELWFDSPEAANKAFNEPKYLEIIRPDEMKFIDGSKCISFVTEDVQFI